MQRANARFNYVTEDFIIRGVKEEALRNDVKARDILDISYMLVSQLMADKKGFSSIENMRNEYDRYLEKVREGNREEAIKNNELELKEWIFNLSDNEGKRFNAQTSFSEKPSDDWMKLFEELIDLFFNNPQVIEKTKLKERPQYSYSKTSGVLTVLDTTEEDFEIISPYILKTVKDINNKIYPEFLEKKNDAEKRNNAARYKTLEFEKERRQQLNEKFNKRIK